jgi:glyoxylase-like metal-dependent hydrolase (beta-lactamase superfamily II)
MEQLENIFLVDTGQFGLKGHGASYILQSPVPVIIETGLSYSAGLILQGLAELGIRREDVGYIMVSHVHLDHAGGAGPLSHACSNATVVVHQRGARHLIRPSHLISSVKEATGPMFEHYGEATPIPASRVLAIGGGETFSLGGGFKIRAMATPGHAPHHLCFYEYRTGALFSGDAVGIYWPLKRRLLPTTPPPSFDLEGSLASLELLRRLDSTTLLYTHFGTHNDPGEMLLRYAELLQAWVEEIRTLRGKLVDEEVVGQNLVEKHAPALAGYCDQEMAKQEIVMNARGVLQYLRRS